MYICSLLFLYFRRAVKISISQVLSFRTKLPELCAPDGTLNINFDKTCCKQTETSSLNLILFILWNENNSTTSLLQTYQIIIIKTMVNCQFQ